MIKEESNDSAAMAAGIIGFTAGIAIGAAMDNDYYYGPYGWHGGPTRTTTTGTISTTIARTRARTGTKTGRTSARMCGTTVGRSRIAGAIGHRAPSSNARIKSRRASRHSRRRTSRTAGARPPRERRRQPAPPHRAPQARGQNRDRSSTAAERSGTKSDAFSNYRAASRSGRPARVAKAAAPQRR